MVIKEGRFGRFLACTQYPEHKETRPLPEELPPGAPDEHCSHGVVDAAADGSLRAVLHVDARVRRDEAVRPAHRRGLPDSTAARSWRSARKKGRTFYGCANWPGCDWVSWQRPLTEPCPECGGLQVDMGRGRVRCLKHEGEPPAVREGRAQ